MEMCEPEPAADETAVAEEPFDLCGRGVRGNVEVLGSDIKKDIAHAPAYEKGGKASGSQGADDLDCFLFAGGHGVLFPW
jgi:hypothetical protein